jgi:hypothetical protein
MFLMDDCVCLSRPRTCPYLCSVPTRYAFLFRLDWSLFVVLMRPFPFLRYVMWVALQRKVLSRNQVQPLATRPALALNSRPANYKSHIQVFTHDSFPLFPRRVSLFSCITVHSFMHAWQCGYLAHTRDIHVHRTSCAHRNLLPSQMVQISTYSSLLECVLFMSSSDVTRRLRLEISQHCTRLGS